MRVTSTFMLLLSVSVLPTGIAKGQEFISLGFGNVGGVSPDGFSVVGSTGGFPYRWDEVNGLIDITQEPVPFGFFGNGAPHDASLGGQFVVGGMDIDLLDVAFRWDETSGIELLGDLPGGEEDSHAWAISADGSVVVGSASAEEGSEAFRWDEGSSMMGLGDLPGGTFQSFARDTSHDGFVVVGRGISALGPEAFRWDPINGMVGLGSLGGDVFLSSASGVSSDGSVVVGSSFGPSGNEAFRWDSVNGMVGLGSLPGKTFASNAMAASGDGSVIVGFSGVFGENEAFIWDAARGMRRLEDVLIVEYGLDVADWELTRADGVSDDARTIAGTGLSPGGQTEAWVAFLDATPTPTPTPTATPRTCLEPPAACTKNADCCSNQCSGQGGNKTCQPEPTPTPTPEPGVMLQLVSGGVGLAFLNKRRMRKNRRAKPTN
jgi:probable HAF family extracellular repeat protein